MRTDSRFNIIQKLKIYGLFSSLSISNDKLEWPELPESVLTESLTQVVRDSML